MLDFTSRCRVSDLELFRTAPLFRRIPDDLKGRLLADAIIMNVPADGTIFWKDETASRIYLVLDGEVKLYNIKSDGEEAVLTLISPGYTFGELDVLASARAPKAARHSLNADTIKETRLMVFPAKSIIHHMQDHADIALSIVEALSQRAWSLLTQIEQFQLQSTSERVANFLLKSCASPAGSAMIELPFKRHLIAKRLGMSPETFSRALSKLRVVGVEATRTSIHVTDVERLRGYCKLDQEK